MPEYAEKFKRLLMEEIDISRNRDDAHIDPDVVSPDEFNVDPMSANVGFSSLNSERYTKQMSSVIKKLKPLHSMLSDLMPEIKDIQRLDPKVKKSSLDALGDIITDIYGVIGALSGQEKLPMSDEDLQKNDNTNRSSDEVEGDY